MHLPTDPSDEGIKAFSQGDPGSRPYDTPVLTQEAPSRVPSEVQSGYTQTDHAAACSAAVSTPPGRRSFLHTLVPAFVQTSWMKKCYSALKSILPVYIAIHLAFIVISGTESLFLCLALLSFYNMRHGNWWLAGLFGFLASLTRSAGLFLIVPFCFEYLRQHQFNLRAMRFDILSFQAIHNLLDLGPDVFILLLIILSFVGPWKLPRNLWAYNLYAVTLFLFFQLYPTIGIFPLTVSCSLYARDFPSLHRSGQHRQEPNAAYELSYGCGCDALLFADPVPDWTVGVVA